MRLIDADDLLKQLEEGIWNSAVEEVKNQPTAYDVDAVVRELEAAREPHKQIADGKLFSNRDRVHAIGIVGAYNHAIEIVRGGRND